MQGLVQVVANEIAGGGRGRAAATRLAAELERRGFAVDTTFTERAGHAAEIAATLDGRDCHTVVAVGGDGTVNEVVRGLRSGAPRLAVLPLGTGNVLAAELGLRNDPAALADAIEADHSIRARVARADDRRFLLFAGFGPDARMVQRLADTRRGRGGKVRWVAPVLHVIRRWQPDHILVRDREGTTHGPFGEVLITRIRNYGGWFHMPGPIDIENDSMHAVCFPQTTRFAFAGATVRAWRRSLRAQKDVHLLEGSRFDVTSADPERPVPCQVDGDPAGPTPTRVELLEHAVRIVTLAPRRSG